uniref:Uncharacterized protein n=1 Tax=Anguilla anguilla TaxID=7936 RepID=A0A0E9U7H0_ANGAN
MMSLKSQITNDNWDYTAVGCVLWKAILVSTVELNSP